MGTTLTRRNDWGEYLAAPVATRSSKPESVEKEIAKKREKQEEQAPFIPVTGTVSSCVIIDQDGNSVFEHQFSGFLSAVSEGEISYNALTALYNALLDDGESRNISSMTDIGCRVYGLGIKQRIRIMLLDAMGYQVRENQQPLNPGLWFHHLFEPGIYADPYEVVLPSETRKDVSWDCLCKFFDIPLPNTELDTDAHSQAEIARQLAIKANLFQHKG